MSKTNYVVHQFQLTSGQTTQLSRAIKTQQPINIRLSYKQLSSPQTNADLPLTMAQLGAVTKAIDSKKGLILRLSATQIGRIKNMMKGGFLPLLAGLLPSLGTIASTLLPTLATGALSGLAGWGTSKLLDATTGKGLATLGSRSVARVGDRTNVCVKDRTNVRGSGLYTLGYSGRGFTQQNQYGLLPTHQYPEQTRRQPVPISIKSRNSITPAGALM